MTTPEKKKKSTFPFTIASINAIGKDNGCSISSKVPSCLFGEVDQLINYVPTDKQYKVIKDGKKSIQCSKAWFNQKLGNLSRIERENVRINVQILLTRLLYLACKMTKEQKKVIVTEFLVKSTLKSFRWHFKY